ncbi:hypothetical protein JVU11DRAFT_2588 [Chiua virens]|nr:hypothetical protein JVU11DRAFT_2588 [Chiua virens]
MPPKTSSRNKNRKLTDFFLQPSSASAPLSTTPSAPMEKAATTSATRIQTRLVTRASKAIMEDECSAHNAPRLRSVSTASRKRAHSPDAPIDLTTSSPTRRKSPKKRMKVFGSDPDVEKPTAVVYVKSPFPPRNTQKLATPHAHSNTLLVTSPTDSSNQVIYSSQSDEAELVLPTLEPRDLGKVVEGVHTWRLRMFQTSTPSPLRVRKDAIDVDPSSSSPLRGSLRGQSPSLHLDASHRSTGTTKRSASPQTPLDASTCLPSPPDTKELPPLPSTPKSLDPETKTARIIAEIQAKARAAALSSDGEETLVYRELEDSDDDDDEIMGTLPLIGGSKRPSVLSFAPQIKDDIFSSPLSSVPSAFNDAAMSPSTSPDRRSPPTRRSLRTRKLAPSFRLPKTTPGPSASVGVTKYGSSSNHKKPQAKNPLQALLREKELQNKRGTGGAAFRQAEEVIRQGSCETSVGSSDDLNTMDQLSLTDEQAAWRAVHESRKSTSPDDASDVEGFTLGNHEAKMLGSDAGEAINKILVGDRCSKSNIKAQTKQKATSGVALWVRPSDMDMVVDLVSIPPLSGHPILTRLDESLRSGDDGPINLVLCAGALAVVPPEILILNMPYILVLTLLGSSQISNAVGVALRDLWGLNPRTVSMPFTAISFALVRLGASPSVLEKLGLIRELAGEHNVGHAVLIEALRRLLAIVKAAAFAGAFSSDDIANVMLSLVLIGLDPLTSDDLRTHLNITMDVICNHGASDHLLDGIREKVLNFAAQLAPVDKTRLVSFFASGGGRTRRIARQLAYSLLVSAPMGPTFEDKVPSLEQLILLLSPEAGSCEPFDVTNESTDYEVLSHYVNLLSVALDDLVPYVEEENGSSIQGSPGKPKKPPVPPLELLCRVLELLQSKIVDTRAAHLDRSRTKAAIQRLTMRIRYDRMALIGIRPRQRASTLKAYFSPQRQ